VTTLVCCIDRDSVITTTAGVDPPVAGWEAVRSLVTDVGLDDPESTTVNCLLEALRTTRELRDDGDDAVVAVLSADTNSQTAPDRTIAAQLDTLIEQHDPDSSIVVIGAAEDERLLPVVESRLQVDGVDRVVVRQARDIESTYYLLKQFLADEELRSTILVPLGISLLLVPALLLYFSFTIALAGLAALLGLAVLYKGLGIDEYVERVPEWSRELLYSGRVSVVTYVTAVGLLSIGLFSGGFAVTGRTTPALSPLSGVAFLHHSLPWLTLAAVTASTGRLFDELIQADGLRVPTLSLPFGLLSVGIVIRGFTGYVFDATLTVGAVMLSPTQRLALVIVVGVAVSLVGVKVATMFESSTTTAPVEQSADGSQ
jgi:Predicted membrane protein